jgi:uncharacterized membrane protein
VKVAAPVFVASTMPSGPVVIDGYEGRFVDSKESGAPSYPCLNDDRLALAMDEQHRRTEMAIDTFIAFTGVYPSVEDALADYHAVHLLHTDADLIDGYDAAVIERRDNGKTKIVKKHETPTRVGGVLGGSIGLATGLIVALFPAAAIGGGLLLGTTAGGALLGSIAGHAAAGMSRSDLKELGETLDTGQAGLVVVAVADMEARIESAMERAQRVQTKELRADQKELEQDAKQATEAS